MRPNLPCLLVASNTLLKPGGLLRWNKRLVKDTRLFLPLTEVMKITRLTSPLLDMPHQSLPRPRLRHGRRLALLSHLSLTLNLYTLLHSIAGSPSSSPNFPHCSSPREWASVYAAYLRSRFSVSQAKALHSRARGYLSELRQATCSAGVSLVLLLSILTRWISCGCLQPFLVPHHWPRQSCLSHAKAPYSLWHEFSSLHLQSLLVFSFLSFHLEDIFHYFHTQDGKASPLSCFLQAYLSHLLRIKAV